MRKAFGRGEKKGRKISMSNCRNCRGLEVAGFNQPGSKTERSPAQRMFVSIQGNQEGGIRSTRN